MTLFGPDGSHHQDGIKANRDDWKAVDVAIWRASIGRRVDRTFAGKMAEAKAQIKPFAAYHFVYKTATHPAALQAATLHSAIGDRSVPVMLDWEPDGPTQQATFDDVLRVAAAIRALGYRVPLLYTGLWWWNAQGKPTLAGHGFDLVNASYGNQKPTDQFDARSRYIALGGDNSKRWTGYGGLDVVMWQFSSRVRFGDRYMDCNAIRLPASNLPRWFRIWTAPAPPAPGPSPTPTPTPEEDDVITADEMDQVWDAPPVARVADDTDDAAQRWFNTMILKAGTVAEVQRRNGLKVTGRYDQPTANAYDAELDAMRKAGG